MNNTFDYFLLVAEESSITRAAKKAHITQQSMSEHIKKLEMEYEVNLFERKPHLHLTEAGSILATRLKQIRHLEEIMRQELLQSHDGLRGTLRVGMHTARAKLIMPEILPSYYRCFPHVSLSIIHAETDILTERLLNGEIDMFLGTDCPDLDEIVKYPLKNASLYVVLSEYFCKKYSFNNYTEDTIDLQDCSSLPFIFSPPDSRLYQTLSHFLADNGIRLSSQLTISDTDTQLLLAGRNIGACFCNELMLPRIHQLNSQCYLHNPLRYYRIKGLTHLDSLSLIYSRYAYIPPYMNAFIQCLSTYFKTP